MENENAPKEYKLLKAETPEELEKLVSQALADGWRPQGGVCQGKYAGKWKYHEPLLQAVVR